MCECGVCVCVPVCSTPRKLGGLGTMQIPLISDPTRAISADYGVLIPDAGIALRGLFIIDPEGVVQQVTHTQTRTHMPACLTPCVGASVGLGVCFARPTRSCVRGVPHCSKAPSDVWRFRNSRGFLR